MFVFIGMLVFQPTIIVDKNSDGEELQKYHLAKTFLKVVVCTINSLLLSFFTMIKLFGILNLKIGQKSMMGRLRYKSDVPLGCIAIYSNFEFFFAYLGYLIVAYWMLRNLI